ncbi:cyclohexanecarboxylate-CoA ligase, partial [Gordonia terrae]
MTSEHNLGRYTTTQVEQFYASGQWTDENFTELLRSRAEAYPDKVFVTDGVYALTYADLYDTSQRLALGFHRRGLTAG